MRDDVTGCGEDGSSSVVAAVGLGRCAHDLYFGRVGRQRAVTECAEPQQKNNRDSADDVAARPRGRFPAAVAALRSIDSQAAQIVVFCVNPHNNSYGSDS